MAVLLLLVVAISTVMGPADARRGRTVRGNGVDVSYFGTNRDDRWFGTDSPPYDESFFGKRGDDKMYGGPGPDTIVGGKGEDILDGNEFGDTLWDDDGQRGDRFAGGDGDDFIVAADGAKDRVDCDTDSGAGDTAVVDAVDAVFNCEVIVSGDTGRYRYGTNAGETFSADATLDEWVLLLKGADSYYGDGENETIVPGAGNDYVDGGGGIDQIIDGDGGPDTLLGGDGDDVIVSADGAIDTVDCGDGASDVARADAFDNLNNCEIVYSG